MHKKVKTLFVFVSFFLIPSSLAAQTSAPVKEKVIITFNEEINYSLLKTLQIDILDDYKYIPSISAEISDSARSALLRDPTVATIEEDHTVNLRADTVDYGMGKLNIPFAWSSAYKGKGIKIGIMDSGADVNHADFKISGGKSFVKEADGYSGYDDYNGHGTHITGIIGGLHNNLGIKGIAPEARIYAIKVFNETGTSNTTDIISGLEWAIDNDMDLVNMSLGFQEHMPAFEALAKVAQQKGVILVAAAGNDGTSDTTKDNVDYPARYDSVLAVSATNAKNERAKFTKIDASNKTTTTYPSTGPSIDLVAPGENIVSTFPDNQYSYMSGTSMATPYATGVLALLMNAYPDKSPDEIRKYAIAHSLDLGKKGKDPVFGNGLIQFAIEKTNITVPDTPQLPFAPTDLRYEVNTPTNSFKLLWTKSSTQDIKGYYIYKNGTKINNTLVTETNYVLPLNEIISSGRTQFTIRSVDLNNNHSADSKTLTVNLGPPLPFKDVVATHWATEDIRYVSKMGWMNGKNSTTTFMPSSSLTRAEAAVIFVRVLEQKETKPITSSFKDVPKSHWAYKEIEIAKQHQLFSGVTPSTFAPNAKITRQEMAVVLTRTINNPPTVNKPTAFKDLSKSHWSYSSITTMNRAAIFGGYSDHTFRPLNPVTRAETASLIKRIHPLVENK